MKKLSLKTVTGLVLTSSLVGVGAFVLATGKDSNNSYASETSSKETLNYTAKTVEEAEQEVLNAEAEKKDADAAVKKAENLKAEAEQELKNAKTEEEIKVAKEKVAKAEETLKEATKVQEQAQAKVDEATKVVEETKAEVKKAQKEEVAKEENKKEPEVTVTPAKMETEKTTATEEKEQEKETTTDEASAQMIVNVAKKTKNALSLTVYDINNKWAKKYNNTGSELITYYSGSSASNGKVGVLYSYTSTGNGNGSSKQQSLFKEMNVANFTIPNASSVKDAGKEWEMQFSGKRTVGVPELNLLNTGVLNAELYTTASSLVNGSAKGLLQNVVYYKVTLNKADVIKWLGTYYNTNNATDLNNNKVDSIEIIVGISNGYVTYISNVNNNNTRGFEIMAGQNGKFTSGKYLKFEVVLTNANSTLVPTKEEMGLSDDAVSALEEEYKAHYGCKKEWVYGDEKYGDYYYWVCNP